MCQLLITALGYLPAALQSGQFRNSLPPLKLYYQTLLPLFTTVLTMPINYLLWSQHNDKK